MTKPDRPQPENLDRATQATIRSTLVSLSDLKLLPERYSHRKSSELEPAALEDLKKSLRLEGMQTPVEYFVDEDGAKILLKGHRRVTALRQLAEENLSDFSLDMQIEALEVSDATSEDLLVRSVADNCQRRDLDQNERLRAAKLLWEAGVPKERAAGALGISVKQYLRDLRVVRNKEMFAHLQNDEIKASTAAKLLEVAESKNATGDLLKHFERWVDRTRRQINEADQKHRLKEGKALPDNKRVVSAYLWPSLVNGWCEAMRRGEPLDDDADAGFHVSFDSTKDLLKIPSANVNLRQIEFKALVRMVARLKTATAAMTDYVAQRKTEVQSTAKKEEAIYETDWLRSLGLPELAAELEAEQRALDDDVDIDASPDDQEDRVEHDLTSEIQLGDEPDEEDA